MALDDECLNHGMLYLYTFKLTLSIHPQLIKN